MTKTLSRRDVLKAGLAGGTGFALVGLGGLAKALAAPSGERLCVAVCSHWSYIGIGWQLGIESNVVSVTDAMEIVDRPPTPRSRSCPTTGRYRARRRVALIRRPDQRRRQQAGPAGRHRVQSARLGAIRPGADRPGVPAAGEYKGPRRQGPSRPSATAAWRFRWRSRRSTWTIPPESEAVVIQPARVHRRKRVASRGNVGRAGLCAGARPDPPPKGRAPTAQPLQPARSVHRVTVRLTRRRHDLAFSIAGTRRTVPSSGGFW